MNDDADSTEKRFDQAVHELETIVGRLESGELTLEDALDAFERGIALVRLLNAKLNRAEKRVEILSRDVEGKLNLEIAGASTEKDS